MVRLKYYLQALGEFPQFLVGILLGIFYSNRITNMNWGDASLVLKVKKFPGGISLGKVIIVNDFASNKTIKHELGHSKQSLWLGPLYLLVIGLPSLVHNIVYQLKGGTGDYYKFYTESWAEKLRRKYYDN